MKTTEKIAGYNWRITHDWKSDSYTAWCDRLGVSVNAQDSSELRKEIKRLVDAIENDRDL